MNRLMMTISGACLLALSGSAAAIMIDDHVYGISSYSLDDFDRAILAYENLASGDTDTRILKQLHEYDQRIEDLVNALHNAPGYDSAMIDSKTGNLIRKEKRLLAMLTGLLTDIDAILQQGTDGDTPEPQIIPLLPEIDEIPEPENGGNPGPVSASVSVLNDTPAQVPEPAMPALLLLGFAALLLPRLRRRR